MDSASPAAPARLACLGGGLGSAVGRAHVTALAMDGRFDLVAGCFSLCAADNLASAKAYGVGQARCYASLDELLAHERARVDAVLILTHTDQHASQVAACLDAGCHVISEKALAGTSEDIRAIQAKERAAGRVVAVTYNYLGYPMVRELREMIRGGELGAIKQIFVEMPQEGFLRKQPDGAPIVPQQWRLRDGPVPTLSLDLGVHVHSLLAFLTGQRPERVSAVQDSFGNFPGLIDNAIAVTRCSGDLLFTTWFSKTALGFRNGLRVRVYGDKAAAEWVQEDPEIVRLADAHGRRSTIDRGGGAARVANAPRYNRFKAGHPAGFIEAFANYYYDVADLLAARPTGPILASDLVYGSALALDGMMWLEAVARSAATGAWADV